MNVNGALESLALQTRSLLCSLDAPALAPFLDAWPAELLQSSISPATLPVLRFMPGSADDRNDFARSLLVELGRRAGALAWRQTYAADDIDAEFLRSYGYAELLGPDAPFTAATIRCGFLLLGPSTLYPRHRHAAEEIYVPLSGTALWQQSDAAWRECAPGTVIHHASGEPHAMQTGASALLALYVWRGNLNQKATLEPRNAQ